MRKAKKAGSLIGWIFVSSLAGVFGAQFEPGTWYALLQKPGWTPPNWVFPVVWPILYVLMGIAAWLAWQQRESRLTERTFIVFFLQLILNAVWSWLFFGLHWIAFALAEIILLWISITVTALLFNQKNSLAGWLLLPYLVWVSYACALNFAIWRLN